MIAFLKCLIFGHKYGRFATSLHGTLDINEKHISIPRIVRFCKCCNTGNYLYPEGQYQGYIDKETGNKKSSHYAELFNRSNNN